VKLIKAAAVFTLIFIGCAAPPAPDIANNNEETPPPEAEYAEYSVLVTERRRSPALLEPASGVYAGVFTDGEDISDFERETAPHEVFGVNIKTGEPFPLSWLLGCVSRLKTPYIVINAGRAARFDDNALAELSETAEQIGQFYAPVFAELYPDEQSAEPGEYIAFFRKAAAIFRKEAPNAAIVFSASDPAAARAYYPGDDYVDWAGVTAVVGAGEPDYERLRALYFYFQRKKPVCVNFAVSHISAENHAYAVRSAAGGIERFYSELADKYPRVKAVNYVNFNALTEERLFEGTPLPSENFLATDEYIIKRAYKNAVASLNKADFEDWRALFDRRVKGLPQIEKTIISPFPAEERGGEIYLRSETLLNDVRASGPDFLEEEGLIPLSRAAPYIRRPYEIDVKKKIIHFYNDF
jgi:hypothetical protein